MLALTRTRMGAVIGKKARSAPAPHAALPAQAGKRAQCCAPRLQVRISCAAVLDPNGADEAFASVLREAAAGSRLYRQLHPPQQRAAAEPAAAAAAAGGSDDSGTTELAPPQLMRLRRDGRTVPLKAGEVLGAASAVVTLRE